MSVHAQPWLRIFGVGLALWVLTVIVTFMTENANLIPTIVLLGSFLAPVTFVAWTFGRQSQEGVTIQHVLAGFLVGGVLGVLGASLLESYLLKPSLFVYVGVGLIEEGVKAAAFLLVARGVQRQTLRGGLLLGAAVGFGFAAFESAGYAFNALLTTRGLDLTALVETEILRGLLAPFGHGLWTAILGGAIFAASRDGRIRFTAGVLGTYLGVSLLHALWDSMNSIAIALTFLLTAQPGQIRLLGHGRMPQPSDTQVHLFTVLNWVGLFMVTAVGLIWLLTLVRDHRALAGYLPERAEQAGPLPPQA